MPYRIFSDTTGNEWQVWDIVPRLSDRRVRVADRRVERHEVGFAERRQAERRMSESPRARLRGSYARGWLCFEGELEKRRLTPIPHDWTTCGEDLLEAYLSQAEPVAGHRRTYYPTDEGPLAEAG